jgi:hypothetical protein
MRSADEANYVIFDVFLSYFRKDEFYGTQCFLSGNQANLLKNPNAAQESQI